MNNKPTTISVLVMSMAILGCGFIQSIAAPATPTPRPISTSTPEPTSTPELTYIPVPRWMILGQPGLDVEILGEAWNYTNDTWGDTYGCIDYTREKEPYLFFEQCFGIVQESLTFESQRDIFLNDGFEVLEPKNTFNDVGQISLLGKRLDDKAQPYIKFFEIIGTEKYILLVEMNLENDDTAPLQTIYESQASEIIDYVLQSGLQKSRILPRPTPTPLAPNQESFYASFAPILITEAEASTLYGSTWEALGDEAATQRTQVCRKFEDRTNADVFWVRFDNCVFSVKDLAFDDIPDFYQKQGDTILESRHKYDDRFVLYGYADGHTYFDAYLLDGEFIHFVNLESRTLVGQSVGDVFTEEVDDFIYGVLMINVKR